MAETAAEPIKDAPATPVEPEKKGRYKPGSRVGAGGTGNPPRFPDAGEKIEPSQFFDELKAIPELGWREEFAVYLYRCEPFTDKRVSGSQLFVKKYFEAVDEQKVMEEEGSGKYLAILNRYDPATRKGKGVYSLYFEILNTSYPPRVPLGEWVDDPRNKKWAWAKEILEREQRGKARDNAGAEILPDLIDKVVGAIQKLRPNDTPEQQNALANAVITMLEKQMERQSAGSSEMLNVVDKIIAAVGSKSDAAGDAVMKILTAQIASMETRIAAAEARAGASRESYDKLVLERLTEKEDSLKTKLEDMAAMKDLFRSAFGRGESHGGGTDWAGVALELGKSVLTVAGGVTQAILARNAAPQHRPAQTVTVNPGQPQLTQPAASNLQLQPNPQETAPATEQNPMMAQLEQINAMWGPMFDMIAPHLVDYFEKSDGYEFREWFAEEHGRFAYGELRKMAPQTLLGVVELRKKFGPDHVRPVLERLTPAEKCAQFLQEFLSDEPDSDGYLLGKEVEPTDDDTPEADAAQKPNERKF